MSPGVTEVTTEARGDQADVGSSGVQSGLGTHVTGTFAVTRGAAFFVYVGGAGAAGHGDAGNMGGDPTWA